MLTVVMQLLARVVITVLLVAVMVACGWKAWRIWFDSRLLLMPFQYTDAGEAKDVTGQAFAQMVSQDLTHIRDMYRSRSVADIPLLPSADQVGRGEEITLPTARIESLPSIELEAYGIKVTQLLRDVNRYLQQARTIDGNVSKRAEGVAVHAELRKPTFLRSISPLASWNIRYAKDLETASFDLSSRLLLHLMRPHAKLVVNASETDFTNFTRALRSYELYLVRLRELEDRAVAEQPLAEANRLISPLLASPERFPLALKLGAFIAREQGNLPEARRLVALYISIAKAINVSDSTAIDFQARVAEKPSESAIQIQEPQPRTIGKGRRTVFPGVSIGVLRGGVGTACCVVQDAGGHKYLLSAGHIFGYKPGVPVLQPAPVDGGESGDAIADTRPLPDGTNDSLKIEIGIALLREDVKFSNDIAKIGKIAGIVDTVALRQKVRLAGRTSGVLEGEVTATALSNVTVEMPSGPTTFDNLIETTKIASPGDSGAPVLTLDNQLIGMAFASSMYTTYVIPLVSCRA